MNKFVRLTCTIPEEDFDEENIFLQAYFPIKSVERYGCNRKYASIATVDGYHEVIKVLSAELEALGILNYSFNVATDFKLKSLKTK